MLRVGLTGGIGSGKSEVSRRLAARGAVVLDADKAARAVVEPGTPGLEAIKAAFGLEVIRDDGTLDREGLGAIVFQDKDKLATLNAIVHPLVRDWMVAAEQQAPPDAILVQDVPLLAENGLKGLYDLVIVVDVPPELQLRRLVELRGMPEDQARARIAAQASREQRLAVADVVMVNDGSLSDLDGRVGEVWDELCRRNVRPPA
ncbi:MAG: dephospho-CoA kinase [Streptosporangiaceae bacterium]|jgi:dephospho-CoA kinase